VREIARRLPQTAYNWAYHRLQRRHGDWSRLPWVIQPVDQLPYMYLNRRQTADWAEEIQLQALEARLRAISTPDGRPVIETVLRARQLYSGARSHLLPDLVPRPYDAPIGEELVLDDGRVRRPPRHSSRDGEHDSDGFYIQVGPGIPAGEAGPELAIESLADYILGPAGIQIPA
jgi:predicted AlkP superfamily phosphohydrolase/phosphomutase